MNTDPVNPRVRGAEFRRMENLDMNTRAVNPGNPRLQRRLEVDMNTRGGLSNMLSFVAMRRMSAAVGWR